MRGIGNFVELFWREGKVSRIPSSLYSNFTDSSINSPSFLCIVLDYTTAVFAGLVCGV